MDVSKKHKFSSDNFHFEIVESTQLAASLRPKNETDFDFLPSEVMEIRSRDSLYHLGDINLMLRRSDSEGWKQYSSARNRAEVEKLPASGKVFASSKLNPSLDKDIPLDVIRRWESVDGKLVLTFELINLGKEPIEVGYLGIPMIFDNILHHKNLEEAHLEKVFYDPYIGRDAGYLQVVRLSGAAPVLLVLPHQNAGFEAYSPLLDDKTPRNITFEGFHDWVIHSKAKAEGEWSGVSQWNEPSSSVLMPGERKEFSLAFVLSEGVRDIEKTLIEENRPVAVGIPGYVVPKDVNAKLFVSKHRNVVSSEVYPQGSLSLKAVENTALKDWVEYEVVGKEWGRSRVTLEYENGEKQTINYKVIKGEKDVIADFGKFLTTEQWYDNPEDLFGRHLSVISYDYEKKEKILEDSRAWVAGLSDEAGAGSWLSAVMKQYLDPDPEEMVKIKQFYYQTLWGGIQYSEGEKKYGVRKSMFYYEPDSMPEGTYSDDVNYSTWSAWSKKEAESTVRSFNYPHVAAAHWVMYRLARFHENLVESHPWSWYLENAFHTTIAMVEQAPHYAQFGQMEGTVFLRILEDLKREGMDELADELESVMKKRADVWAELAYPFGSEMPWDSTGQEEVYIWTDYFGYDQKAQVTLNAVLAYMPTVPHWGYNGSARRYWDFLYGGKLQRIERQLHHYGSAMNAIPVLEGYHKASEDLYKLRVGYGGLLGGISNITEDGFAPAAFHSYPQTLDIDGISGDYGSGFFGYAINSRAYLVKDKIFGWLGFGGNVSSKGDWVELEVTTAGKNAVFINQADLLIETDAGEIQKVSFNQKNGEVKVSLGPKSKFTPRAVLRIKNFGQKEYSVVGITAGSDSRYYLDLGARNLEININ
ncbi:DUF5695 domain-containing protein [Arthrospiribacter ruber]|uniref:Uncharacterized protein n=1 Tax=Arthrospiribacter ruber TaxID=2487934 RepID=A0A951IZF3_9BACT|nr:DUF5695 domain-containing protein [Arthrospiribacter ruber]MBW3468213.1 hypothetical protein [Arthrospiribacter ruber]